MQPSKITITAIYTLFEKKKQSVGDCNNIIKLNNGQLFEITQLTYICLIIGLIRLVSRFMKSLNKFVLLGFYVFWVDIF